MSKVILKPTLVIRMPNNETIPKQPAESSYMVFYAVDATVSKLFLGSDGAANWQEFRSNVTLPTGSVAPTALLKPADRAAGFQSWKEERIIEEEIRRETGDCAMHSRYQHFPERPATKDMNKERQRILERRIGPNQQYFIPSASFVETTRVS
jgi:hypothetical protein